MRILNRLGCISSLDTRDRFVTEHAQLKHQTSICNEISPKVFTVASVDNFDMLQSYAAIYCGDQQRSFHRTTVQLVQPDPNIIFNSQGSSMSIDTTIEDSTRVSGESSESRIVNLNIFTSNSNSTNTDLQVLL